MLHPYVMTLGGFLLLALWTAWDDYCRKRGSQLPMLFSFVLLVTGMAGICIGVILVVGRIISQL